MADEAGHENAERERKATLYVVATPIGNLKDVTLRALEVLKQVDVIAAEDTRVTSRLLDHYGIASRKLIALHEHNEQRAAPRVIELLAAGRSVALTSDAGTPAFSDPGARLIAAVREAGYPVVPIPGPNAAAAALSASGLAGPRFLFFGFLPAKTGERRTALDEVKCSPHVLVFYEAPHRIVETLGELAAVLGGERRIVIARELTKLFETIHVCDLDEAAAWVSARPERQKGEFVLIVDAAMNRTDAAMQEARRVLDILLDALPVKQAAALAAKITGVRKNDLYDLALNMKGQATVRDIESGPER
jgi:16S rRNA (cytidine1402-2'-O)-methyltransferase